jgi:hypothetical protein
MDTTLARRQFDRRLFLTAAILFPLVIFIGFAPTYYLKGLFGTRPLPSNLVHLHGLVMTAWVVLFVVQVRLISAKQVRLHQTLGYAGIGLATLILMTGLPTALRAAKYGSTAAPAGIPPLSFMIVPVADLVMFALFFGAAVICRRRPADHKRLMLLTAINYIPPAIARIPIAALQSLGPLWFFGFPTAIALLCVVLDARRHGRVNKIFVLGTVLLLVSYVARMALMGTQAWINVATWLTTFV